MSDDISDIATRIEFTRAWNRLQKTQMPHTWPRNRQGLYRMRISPEFADRIIALGLADKGDFLMLEPAKRVSARA